MAEGTALTVGQVTPPVNSSVAMALIPAARLWNPFKGAAAGVNSDVLDDSLSLSGASLTEEGRYPADNAVVRAFDKLAGTSLAQSARTQAAVRQSQAQTESGITATQSMVADTHTAVTNVQNSVDANQLANSSLFGFQTGPNACQEVWQFNDSESFFNPVINMQVNASAGGALLMSQVLLRLFTSVNFLMLYNFAESSQGFPDVENLNAAQPQLKPFNQSVLDFLNATLPTYSWEENHLGTGLVGMDWISSGDGITRTYLWSPPAPSLDDFFHL